MRLFADNLFEFNDVIRLAAGKLSRLAPDILLGCMLFVLFYLVARGVRFVIVKTGYSTRLNDDVCELMGKIIGALIVLFGLVTALGTMGVDVSALVASLGLTGFALGFAFKDMLSNVLAGVLILIYRPFDIGDEIEAAKYKGNVIDIDLRYTTLELEDQKVFIPNSTIFTSPISLFKAKSESVN